MINAWSLLYEELNGTMDKTYPIKEDVMTEDNIITSLESDEYDPIVGSGNTASAATTDYKIDLDSFESISINTEEVGTQFDDIKYYASGDNSYPYTIPVPDGFNDVNLGDSKPEPDLTYKSQKYQEDKGIKDLKDYVSSTYRGHYTNKNSDTQTLDLIHSVGDAEAFCRSNAIKYLSRYDKKGSAKNDILKAMHYCLLLYYFSGNTQSPDYTNTRYETF